MGRRTPLMRAMRDVAKVYASLSRDRAASLDEAIAIHERLVTRRDLLLGAATLGAATALAGSPAAALALPPRRFAHDPRIVIVGAGLAGLSCAYELHARGVRADVFEARDRIGGRCWTARGFAYRQTAEHGGEFIDTRHIHVRRLAAKLGLRLEDTFAGYEAEGQPRRRLVVFEGERRTLAEVRDGLEQVVRQLARDAARIGSYRWDQASPAARAFDRTTVREWIEEHVPGGLASILGEYLQTIVSSEYGLDAQDISAIALIDYFIAPYAGGPADERYHVHGGNDQIPHRIAEILPGGSLHLGAPLLSLSQRSDGSYTLSFGGSSRKVVADHVVLCLPFTTLRDVDLSSAGLSAKRLQAIEALGMGTNAKLLLQFRDRLPVFERWNGEVLSDDPRNWSWDSTVNEAGSGAIFTMYTGGRTGASYPTDVPHAPAPEDVVDDALVFLDRWLPGVRASFNGTAWLDSWVDDPWVKGSYAAFLPGQWTSYWGYLGLPEGNVHFAGEHTSTYSQGYLNGGVETGLRAAREVLSATGQPSA